MVWFTPKNPSRGLAGALVRRLCEDIGVPWCEETCFCLTVVTCKFFPHEALFLETTVIYMLGPIINC